MLCKAYIPKALLTRKQNQNFLSDILQIIIEGIVFIVWGFWVKSSQVCSIDTGKIQIKNCILYHHWNMNFQDRRTANFLILKLCETFLEAGIFEERSRSKSFYDWIKDRYYHWVLLPKVLVKVRNNKSLQNDMFVKIQFSPQELAKLNDDKFLTQLNQVLATNKSGLIASVPELNEDGWLVYNLKSSNYNPRLYINSATDISFLNGSLSIQLDEDHIWNMQHQFSGVIAGPSGTGKTSLLFYILCAAVGNEQDKKEYGQQIRLFIIDGKNDQLASIAANFLPHKQWAAGSDGKNVIHYLVNIMHARYKYLQNKRKTAPETIFKEVAMPPILLILDEGASVVASLSKKDRDQYFEDLQQLAQMGRAANITILVAFQQPNANSLPTPIRDQLTGLKIILGSSSQISAQTKQMVFGTGVDLPPSSYKGPGTGYIWLEGNNQPEAFEAPLLPNDPVKLYRLCAEALKDQKHLRL